MGNCRDDLLADYYLRAAGVAVIWIGPDGFIGADDVARLNLEPGAVGYCCLRGAQFILAYRLQIWKQDQGQVSAVELAAELQRLAEAGGVGLTEHSIAAGRARDAVATVNQAVADLQAKGELRELNQGFKAARAVDPSVRYQDFVQAWKARMIEAIASGRTPASAPAEAAE
jgi:hypothetical protein